MASPDDILFFWFGNDPTNPLKNSAKWWNTNPAIDREIKAKFEADLLSAIEGQLDLWKKSPRGCLALIILLDQFSRNIYRSTPKAFAQDNLALQTSSDGQKAGFDKKLPPVERWFFYMPMMHAENKEIQKQSVALFRRLADEAPENLKQAAEGAWNYAVQHAKIVERFGRFPHRNKILGRTSTPEEIEFLKTPGSSF